MAGGLSNKEIANQLVITEGTVKNHVHNALEKLHLSNRTQAAAYTVAQGLGLRRAGPDRGDPRAARVAALAGALEPALGEPCAATPCPRGAVR